MKKTLLSILGVATLAVGSAQSAVVFGNLGETENAGLDELNTQVLGTSRWFAVGVNLAANPGQWYGLETVKLGLLGSANVTLTLFDDSGGSPGSALAQFNTQTVASPGSPALTSFDLSQGGSVTPSGNWTNVSPGNYWFVASSSGFANWVNSASGTTPVEFSPVNVNVGPASPSGWTYVATKFTTNSGTNWSSAIVGPAQNLSISVAAIPEPGTWAAMAILAGGAAFAGWRRRRQQTAA